MAWEGRSYQARFDALAAEGQDVHGEARFILDLGPTSVLDAGCGTGRVAIELAVHGVDVVGVDIDPSMLAMARGRGPGVAWVEADMTSLDLGRTFDVVAMAGNVPLFTAAGTNRSLVAACARHLAELGSLVSGFQRGRGYSLADYDGDCAAAGLVLAGRWATWDREPLVEPSEYAVSVHRRAAERRVSDCPLPGDSRRIGAINAGKGSPKVECGRRQSLVRSTERRWRYSASSISPRA